MTAPSLEEIRGIMRKARNRSVPGANGIPYLVYKKCPKTMKILHEFIKKAWLAGTISDEWKQAEGIFIPKEKEFRPISLLKVEGKIFFATMAQRLMQYTMANQYIRKEVFQASRDALNTPP